MIIKTLFLASFMIASAIASEVEENKPFPAALLVQSNFDFSLIRKEFRVHYGGPKAGSTTASVSINIYKQNGDVAHTYNLSNTEKETKQAFHFALDDLESGAYEVEVCADRVCSARTPSLNNFVDSRDNHKLLCKPLNSDDVSITFIEPTDKDWVTDSEYSTFSQKINEARATAGAAAATTEPYITDFEKYEMRENPSYQKTARRFHTAIKHDLKKYQRFFANGVDDYCGRKYMLSVHSHIIEVRTKKVLHRYKTVNHLSDAGKKLFILGQGGEIILESTHENVDIPDGTYQVWVSLCVTDKDDIESTYCANPITKELTVTSE